MLGKRAYNISNKIRMEEQNIITEVMRDNPEAYVHLMHRYGQQVFTFIARLVDNEQEAEELAQDTFIKAFRHIHMYDGGKASFSTWLLRIAYHETMNHFRHRKLPTVYLADVFTDGGRYIKEEENESFVMVEDEELEQGLSTGDHARIQCLKRCIELLSVEERSVLILYYFDNHPVQDIAHILGLKPTTLASRLYRIRRKLYDMIKNEMKKSKTL